MRGGNITLQLFGFELLRSPPHLYAIDEVSERSGEFMFVS